MAASAPVALFVYRRLGHTRRTVEALAANYGAGSTELLVYSDGPQAESDREAVTEVREYIGGLRICKTIRLICRGQNLGLADSMIRGVSQTLADYDRVIVLQDDDVTSPYFLSYMNAALEQYKHDDRVISISGYVYPARRRLPSTFFIKGADCWGWATWRRGWAWFNPDGRALLEELRHRRAITEFDFNDSSGFSRMLERQVAGLNDSWAVRWYASAFLNDKLTLYPGRSLVQNIGSDATGTHRADTTSYNVSLASAPVRVGGIAVEESSEARRAFGQFFRERRSRPNRWQELGRRVLGARQLAALKRLIRGAAYNHSSAMN